LVIGLEQRGFGLWAAREGGDVEFDPGHEGWIQKGGTATIGRKVRGRKSGSVLAIQKVSDMTFLTGGGD
jgi:hypothetical protein